jgi:predicted RNase H-like nuclease
LIWSLLLQNQVHSFTLNKEEIYIGIDLAWGEKNPSGFCVLQYNNKGLKLLDVKLLLTLTEILEEISKYQDSKVCIGVDAPLLIPNESGNREIEKEFNKDFSSHKISMLPVNQKIMQKYSPSIRSQKLYEALYQKGYRRNKDAKKSIFEVYPHATIAVCFNQYNILPYKRKKGRSVLFIKEQLTRYQGFLQKVLLKHPFLQEEIKNLRGASLKAYEDQLDAISSAYTLFYIQSHPCKYYELEQIPTLVSPI